MSSQNGEHVIRIQNLSKSFGEQKVLKGIDLQVSKGETIAVLGRSGRGKSVLLKLVVGLLKPDSGSIQIYGQDITQIPLQGVNELRKKMGFLFQQGALYDSLTVEENVAFPLRRHTKKSNAEIHERVDQLLSRVEMQDSAKKLPSEISGGMQDRKSTRLNSSH